MIRIASVIGLAAENIERYETLHRDVWHEVLSRLTASNVGNYSIFRYGEMLFSYMEYAGDDLDRDMAAIAQDQTTQSWWAICNPLQSPVPERIEGEWWHVIPEIFHLE